MAARIREALHTKKVEHEGSSEKALTLEKIVLRMEKMKKILNQVKKLFKGFSENQEGKSVTKPSLVALMGRLNMELSDNEVDELFAFVDIDLSSTVDFREFLIALSCYFVLGKLTAEKLTSAKTTIGDNPQTMRRSLVSSLTDSKAELIEMLDLILSAYLLFDPRGDGYVSKPQVEAILEEHGKAGGGHSDHYLSRQLWGQMDWDHNGRIDFGEFVLQFSRWTDFDNEIEEGVEE